MWANADGWFVGAAARHFWTDMRLTGYAADGGAVTFTPRQSSVALSLEAGRRIGFGLLDVW
jgi:hypothetical protein